MQCIYHNAWYIKSTQHLSNWVCVCVCVCGVCIQVTVYTHTHTHTHIHTYIVIQPYTDPNIYIYIYIHTHTHTQIWPYNCITSIYVCIIIAHNSDIYICKSENLISDKKYSHSCKFQLIHWKKFSLWIIHIEQNHL